MCTYSSSSSLRERLTSLVPRPQPGNEAATNHGGPCYSYVIMENKHIASFPGALGNYQERLGTRLICILPAISYYQQLTASMLMYSEVLKFVTRAASSLSADLVPGPVQNLRKITDPKQASVRLIWDPPLNFKRPGEVTAYHIRFKPRDKSTYDETVVDVTTTSILLARSMGLKASTMYAFEVGALNAEHAAAEWKTISAFTGMCKSCI